MALKIKGEKKKKDTPRSMEDSARRMTAKVISIRDGVEDFENVRIIYLDSQNYTLMIMPDHTPVIGEIQGSVRIMTDEGLTSLPDASGFYVLRGNEFQLLLKDTRAGEDPVPEGDREESEDDGLEMIDLDEENAYEELD